MLASVKELFTPEKMETVQERMERLGTKQKIASFMQKEKQPYEFKRKYAQIRAEEFATAPLIPSSYFESSLHFEEVHNGLP